LKRAHWTWGIALAIAAATVAVYLPALDNGFVNYDDDLYILNNPHVQRGLGAETVTWAFTTFRGANWFPLTWLSWAVDFALYGRDPAGFHLTSLILHVANSVLLFFVFERLTGARWRSAFVAAVFALHPLHVESVAWAAARKDVLSGLFAVLVLLAYERMCRRGRAGRGWALHWAVFGCLALGLMAKPTLVTWPFVLLLLDEWPLGRLRDPLLPERWERARLRRAVLEKLPLFALVGAFSAVAVASQSHWGTLQDFERLPVSLRIGNALTSYGAYLVDAFWPVDLAVFYPHPGHSLETWRVVAAAGALLAASVGALLVRRRHPEYAVGWFWYLGVLVPVIGLVQVGQAARADRYTYLPLIGLSIPVVWGAAAVAMRGRVARAVVATVACAAVAALGVSAHAQVKRWRDSARHALAVTENNHVAHINLGVTLLGDGAFDRAARHLQRALVLAPASATAAGVLGDVRRAQERPQEAVTLYGRALQRQPNSLRWHEGMGNALFDQGRAEGAVRSYRRALEIKANAARIHGRLGVALYELGRHGEAAASFAEAVRLEPGNGPFHAAFALALDRAGRDDEAIRHYREAIALGERSVASLIGLARLSLSAGDADEAIPLAEEAVGATQRRIPAALALLGEAYAAAGRMGDAIRVTEEAAALAEARGKTDLLSDYRARIADYREGRQL
jgi:tetratricopeptide (TPR) repeat protein